MNYEAAFKELAQQYQASGGDVSDAMNWLNTMATDDRTPFLKLNQWKRSDKPVMEDFNEDNKKIDAGFRELSEKKADISHLVKYDLELIDGITKFNEAAACYYTRNPFHQVNLVIRALATIEMDRGIVIARLPQGFRPAEVVATPVLVGNVAGSLEISPDGTIRIYAIGMPFQLERTNIFCTAAWSAAVQ